MRMKRLLTFLTLLTVFIGVGWAEESRLTFTAACGGTGTANDGAVWTVTSDASESTYNSTDGIHYGTNSASVQYLQLSTSDVPGTITKVAVIARDATASGVMTVTVGGTPFTCNGSSTVTNTSNTQYIFTGSGSGTIVVRIDRGTAKTKAIYCKAITVTYSSGSTQAVATPTFSPAAGTYSEAQNVTISCATSGATIHYTADGSTPTTNSPTYSSAIPVNSTTTIKAIAVKSGMNNSSVATATYTITAPLTSLAAVNGLNDNEVFTYGAQTVVLGVNGKNMYIVMPDNTAGTLVYANENWSNDYAFGKVINSGWGGTKTTYSTKPEVKNPTNFSLSGETAEVTPIEITSSDLTKANFGRYAVLKGVTVTSGGAINGITTYNQFGVNFNSSAGSYDVYGVIGWHNSAGQFMPLEYVPASAPAYYLAGSFNNWEQNDDYIFTESNGTYTLNGVDLPDNAEFQIIKVVNDNTSWYGGATDDNEYGIHGGWHENITLTQGAKNFRIEAGAITNFSFTVNNGNPSVLNVNRDPQLFIKTSNDNFSTKTALASASDGWTMNRDFTANESFGFVDEWGYWHGKEWTIKSEHFGQDIPMETSSNYVMELAGNYNLAVNAARSTLVVTSTAGDTYTLVTSASELNENDSYIIVSKDYESAMGEQGSNNRRGAEVTINGNNAIATDAVEVFSLEGNATDGWYFKATKINTGYLYAASNSSNHLKTEAEPDANGNAKASISIDASSGVASVVFQGTNSHKVMQYNSGSDLFACYSEASQKAVYLYKKGSTTPPSDQVATPVITPGSTDATDPYVVYGGKQQITINCATSGATIYYTTDGSTPTTSSNQYSEPFDLTSTGGNVTVKAIAVSSDMDDSEIATSYYRFTSPKAPTFDPATGAVRTEAFDVTISSEYDDAVIYYMLDPASAPTAAQMLTNGTLYENPVNVSGEGSHTIYAMVVRNGIKSSVVNATYTITSGTQPSGDGDYVKVTNASDLTDGEYLIVYEGDGNGYGPFAFNGALSTLDATNNIIDVEINDYTIPSTPTVDAAIFTITTANGSSTIKSASGYYIGQDTYDNGLDQDADAITNIISFDDNGNAVITAEGVCTLRFNSASNQNRFRYYKSGQQAIALYKKIDNNNVKTPVITPASKVFTEEFDATITCSTQGATIYYTIDGTDPTTSSAVYSNPIHVDKTMTIKAIAAKDDEVSGIAKAVYQCTMVENIAEYLELPIGTDGIVFKNPVVVQYHYISSSGKSYIYVKDDTGCAYFHQPYEIEGTPSMTQLENGDVIGAGFSGDKDYDEALHGAISEYAMFTNLQNFAATGNKALAEPELKTTADITANGAAALNNHYITINKVKLSALYQAQTWGDPIYFDIDDAEGIGYNKFHIDYSVVDDLDAYYNITGIFTAYNNELEFHPTEIYKWAEKEVTLADLCENGREGESYKITNNLQGVVAVGTSLWVKDENGQSIHKTSPAADDDFFDIEASGNTRHSASDYDQSNWCEIVFPDAATAKSFENTIIEGYSIEGVFNNKTNPKLTLSATAQVKKYGNSDVYAPNYYLPTNFTGSQSCNTEEFGEEGHGHFFFNDPKPQEYAQIVWAIYDGTREGKPVFIISPDPRRNSHLFTGEFVADLSLNTGVTETGQITEGYGYDFIAIIRKVESSKGTPSLMAQGDIDNEYQSDTYIVYPLDLDEGQDPVTSINDINAGNGEVKSVKFYNVAGIESATPFQGVNIVVTEYTDGTRTTTKMLCR